MKGQELKPCPFCGGAAEVQDHRLVFMVKCLDVDCAASVIGERSPELESEEQNENTDWDALQQTAIDRWNRRQPENKAALIKVGGQFFDDGRWWNFMNEEHKANTIAAGYLVRDLYVEPDGQ